MNPGPAIKRLRLQREWKLEDLATAVENHLGKPVNTGNLSRLEREKQGYSNDLIQAIAAALEVEVSELFHVPDGGVAPADPAGKLSLTGKPTHFHVGQVVTGLTPASVSPVVYSVPVLEVDVSMGVGALQPEIETIVGTIDLSQEYVRRNFPEMSNPSNLRFVSGRGNSMWDPERRVGYQDGDLLFVDVGITEVRTEAAYVFVMDGELYVKALQRLPTGHIQVISYNRSYPQFTIENRDEMRVIGRVLGAWTLHKM